MTASSARPSSASRLSLSPGEVHLWLCPEAAASALDASVLRPDEAERHGRRGGPGLSGRVLTRHILSRYAAEQPADWVFETGRHGKPELVAPSRPLHQNLSHSGQWLAVAVSESAPVGVDVQVMDAERRIRRLAKRYFSAAEQEDLESREGEDFTRHFYRLWSLKEAWTKARGDALPAALGTTAFRMSGGRLISLDPTNTEDCSLWLLELEGYGLALCGLEGGLSLRCLRWDGEASAAPLELPIFASARAA